MNTYTLILSANPVNPADACRVIKRYAPEKLSDAVEQMVGDLPVTVYVAGVQITDLDVQLVGGEFVEIIYVARDPVSIGSFLVSTFSTISATIASSFFLKTIAYIGFTALVGNLARALDRSDSRTTRTTEVPVYSLENGINEVREFASMPRVIGKHRIFPDLVAKPFTELYIGPDDERAPGAREVDLSTVWFPRYEAGEWTDIGNGTFLSPDPYAELPGDAFNIVPPAGSAPQYVYRPNALCSGGQQGEYLSYAEYQANGDDWPPCFNGQPTNGNTIYFEGEGFSSINGPDDPGAVGVPPPDFTINYTAPELVAESRRSQRLTQIFNAGWGDLVITEPRIRETNLEEYSQVRYEVGVQNEFACELRGYPLISNEATEHQTRFATEITTIPLTNPLNGITIDFLSSHFPETVTTVEGGALRNNDEVNALEEQFVERTSPRDTVLAQIDFAGRLHNYDNNGIGLEVAEYEVQYAPEGSGDWVSAPGSPFKIANDNTNLVQRPFVVQFPDPGYWDIRTWQVTPDPNPDNPGNRVIDMSVSEIKFQRNWISRFPVDKDIFGLQTQWPANTYIEAGEFDTRGQNRLGVVIGATEQLSGTIQKFDVIVSSKTWTYIGGPNWDGTNPGDSANWVWDETSNPADWFINEALGGYFNSSGSQITPLVGRGWNLGPHPENEERLFGSGLDHSEIDYENLLLWRDFCVREDLQVDAFLKDGEPTDDLLNKIAAVGRGSRSWWPGKLSVVWEEKNQEASAMFNAANILIDTFEISYISDELPQAYRGTYVDATDNRYEQQHYQTNRPDLGATRFISNVGAVDLWGVTRPTQARRAIRLEAGRALYQRRQVSFQTSMEGFHTIRGDVVLIAHDLKRWAIGSRLYEVEAENGFIRRAKLPKPQRWDGSGPLYAVIRHPNGMMFQGEVVSWSGESDNVELIGDWWQSSDGPEYGDHLDTLAEGTDCFGPEDFLINIGPQVMPGKRFRVIEVEPQGEGFQLTCVDEVNELWIHDNGDERVELFNPTIDSQEHIDVRVLDCSITKDSYGQWWAEWDSQGASEFTVSISVNGGPWATGQAVHGNSIPLPDYQAGTVLNLSVCPCVDATDANPYPVGAVPTQIYQPGCCEFQITVPAPNEVCA